MTEDFLPFVKGALPSSAGGILNPSPSRTRVLPLTRENSESGVRGYKNQDLLLIFSFVFVLGDIL